MPKASQQTCDLSLLSKLQAFGDARKMYAWVEGTPTYAAELQLSSRDIPELIKIARLHADRDYAPEGDAAWAPHHAWRALGQMRAVEAVEPLLAVLEELSRMGDDWYLEEFPHVFGMIGPPAMPALVGYASDGRHSLYPRTSAARALYRAAEYHPQSQQQAIGHLNTLLAEFEHNDQAFNAFLVGSLLDLNATESAELIEGVFSAGCVDESIVCWAEARRDLQPIAERADSRGIHQR